MADDPQNPTPDSTDGPQAGTGAEATPSRGGFGRFASRFRRGQDAPTDDAAEDAAEDAGDATASDVAADQQANVPVLLNRPDVDWSTRGPARLSASDTVDPEETAIADEAPRDAPAETESPVVSTVVVADVPPVPDVPATRETPSAPLAPTDIDDATEPPLPDVATTGPRTRPAGISAHLAVLTGLATAVVVAFLLIEPSPRWLLLLGAAAVVFGLDGTLRQTWRAPFALGQETAPFLFAPALYMLAVPVLIEHNVSGEFALLVGIGAGLGFGGLAWAEVASVRPQAAEYEQARIVVTANTYLAGFAIFSLSYVFEIGLPAAIIATSIAASMLAVEILREGEIDPMETLGLSLVTGIVIGEFRWLLYYVPLDTYLAGLTLLLVFYLATGLLHSHVIRALNRLIALEYGGIAAAGLALVVFARAVGLA